MIIAARTATTDDPLAASYPTLPGQFCDRREVPQAPVTYLLVFMQEERKLRSGRCTRGPIGVMDDATSLRLTLASTGGELLLRSQIAAEG